MNPTELIGDFGILGILLVVLMWAKPVVGRLVDSHLAFVAKAGERLDAIENKVDRLLRKEGCDNSSSPG